MCVARCVASKVLVAPVLIVLVVVIGALALVIGKNFNNAFIIINKMGFIIITLQCDILSLLKWITRYVSVQIWTIGRPKALASSKISSAVYLSSGLVAFPIYYICKKHKHPNDMGRWLCWDVTSSHTHTHVYSHYTVIRRAVEWALPVTPWRTCVLTSCFSVLISGGLELLIRDLMEVNRNWVLSLSHTLAHSHAYTRCTAHLLEFWTVNRSVCVRSCSCTLAESPCQIRILIWFTACEVITLLCQIWALVYNTSMHCVSGIPYLNSPRIRCLF